MSEQAADRTSKHIPRACLCERRGSSGVDLCASAIGNDRLGAFQYDNRFIGARKLLCSLLGILERNAERALQAEPLPLRAE